MPDYHDMTDAERFAELDRMATDYFGTTRWRVKFCARYGLNKTTPTKWRAGPPQWALVAMGDACFAKAAHGAAEGLRRAIAGVK